MANLLDYLDWRGDLPLETEPFNELDNLILAELSFIDFDGIVCEQEDEGVPLREAARRYFAAHPEEDGDLGVLVPGQYLLTMLKKLAENRRFSDLRLVSYVNQLDEEKEMQFAALSIEVAPRLLYVAFRGTDDTLVGWKEDFNMAFLSPVPAQTEAAAYLQRIAKHRPKAQLMVGGHSKGGNLAVYAAVKAGEKTQERIIAVYNNDGPGFGEALLETAEHRRIERRIRTIVPETDVVGMLLSHEERYCVVRSDQSGMMQHDGFSWQVRRDSFVHLSDISREGHMVNKTVQGFVNGLDRAQREKFADALYEILSANDAKTLSDLQKGKWKTVSAMMKASRQLDEESREVLEYTLKLLFREGAKGVRDAIALGSALPALGEAQTVLENAQAKLGETLPKLKKGAEKLLPKRGEKKGE